MTATRVQRPATQPSRRDCVVALCLALAWLAATAIVARHDPMTFAFAGLLGVTGLLPLADRPFATAAAIVVGGVIVVSGPGAATVVAAVAFALWGGVALLTACWVDSRFAAMLVLVASLALLTWPIWAATLLLRFDVQPLVDGAVRFGPLFAINRAIDATDAFTHRPWSYRWMNLGQDVPYAMPTTIWPCVAVHAATGAAGWIVGKSRDGARGRRNVKKPF